MTQTTNLHRALNEPLQRWATRKQLGSLLLEMLRMSKDPLVRSILGDALSKLLEEVADQMNRKVIDP